MFPAAVFIEAAPRKRVRRILHAVSAGRASLPVDAALPKTLVLDMGGVTFMDSSGIALILRAQQRMQLLDGSVLVCNVPQQAKRVLDAAGIGRLVTIR